MSVCVCELLIFHWLLKGYHVNTIYAHYTHIAKALLYCNFDFIPLTNSEVIVSINYYDNFSYQQHNKKMNANDMAQQKQQQLSTRCETEIGWQRVMVKIKDN